MYIHIMDCYSNTFHIVIHKQVLAKFSSSNGHIQTMPWHPRELFHSNSDNKI